mgnify:CR=1 FL=1
MLAVLALATILMSAAMTAVLYFNHDYVTMLTDGTLVATVDSKKEFEYGTEKAEL